ncbi:MAG TPA: hypothetical protein VM261_38495 [Kofleriaceae bacterium]|nr:hypothetical protein [Kofleriaceae bacterium]
MRSAFGVAAIVVLLGACGPKKGPDGGGGGGGGGGGSDGSSGGGGGTGAGSEDGSGSASASAPLTRADCEKMIDHVLQIGMEEQRKTKPAEYVPTEAQVADIRAKMVEKQLEPCLEWPRPVWECTMAAPTVAALYACAEGN